jgi:hypothetical protein
MAKLEMFCTAMDMAKQAMLANTVQPNGTMKLEYAVGAIDEQTLVEESISGSAIAAIKGRVSNCKIKTESNTDGWDTIRCELEDAGIGFPKSFGGTSGGGVWSIYIRPDESGNPICEQKRFVGVLFWEDYDKRHLIGHGSKSIYDKLLPAILG